MRGFGKGGDGERGREGSSRFWLGIVLSFLFFLGEV